jgi:hypothetical protein
VTFQHLQSDAAPQPIEPTACQAICIEFRFQSLNILLDVLLRPKWRVPTLPVDGVKAADDSNQFLMPKLKWCSGQK